MKTYRIGAWLISFVALVTIVSPYLADWNATHLYNPNWPPHAKFHDAMTILIGTYTGILSLWFVWNKRGDRQLYLQFSAWLSSIYWVTISFSIFLPNTAFFDPDLKHPVYVAGLPIQLFLASVLLSCLIAGYTLEMKRLKQKAQTKFL